MNNSEHTMFQEEGIKTVCCVMFCSRVVPNHVRVIDMHVRISIKLGSIMVLYESISYPQFCLSTIPKVWFL